MDALVTPPTRRIWIYPAPDGTLEVILLGSIAEIAWEFAAILKSAEAWVGFEKVDPIAVGSTVLGMRCSMSMLACGDPIQEAMAWLGGEDRFIHRVSWHKPDSWGCGRVGVW
jgi:hypothetical protein